MTDLGWELIGSHEKSGVAISSSSWGNSPDVCTSPILKEVGGAIYLVELIIGDVRKKLLEVSKLEISNLQIPWVIE